MARYSRGPVIPDIETLIFCIMADDHIYHDRAILPGCQLRTWNINKMLGCIENKKLFKAEYR